MGIAMGYDATGKDYDRKAAALEKKEKGLKAYDKKHGTNRMGEHSRDEQRKYNEGKAGYKQQQREKKNKAPVTQHSPTKVHFPGWRMIILGGSGGIRKRVH